jgi:hypothetical protein
MKEMKETSVSSSIEHLRDKGTVQLNESIFKKVIKAISTKYSELIQNKSVTVDYATFQITLN